jgi:hypothetical protein
MYWMDKKHIIEEITRTALANNGVPLGTARFAQETGIQKTDWYGKYWARWGDALKEAGFIPNELQGAYKEEFVMEKLIELIRELGRYPVAGDLRLKARNDSNFPSHNVFSSRGSKKELANKVIAYCLERNGFEDVIAICKPVIEAKVEQQENKEQDELQMGFVYLMKSGRFFKIGKSNSVGRREYELSIQMPEKLDIVHAIKTDDLSGIEAYWHKRFADKRKKGEWFDLSNEDVKAFKRRKFM